jgi:hypothetical protein
MQESIKYLVLKLHSLPDDKKQWIMSRLTSEERNKIIPLLEDLGSIKNTFNKKLLISSLQLLNDHRHGAEIEPQDDTTQKTQKLIKKLDRVESEKIIKILNHEEPWIIALLYTLYDWGWLGALDKTISTNKKLQIQQYIKNGINNIKPTVCLTLLETLLDSLEHEELEQSNQLSINFDKYTTYAESRRDVKQKKWWKEIWQS